MVRVNDMVPVPPELAALKVTFEVPAVVGVPEIRPVPVLMVSPAGSPVALKLVGLLVAVICRLKATPTVPDAVVALVMTGAGGGAAVTVTAPLVLAPDGMD